MMFDLLTGLLVTVGVLAASSVILLLVDRVRATRRRRQMRRASIIGQPLQSDLLLLGLVAPADLPPVTPILKERLP